MPSPTIGYLYAASALARESVVTSTALPDWPRIIEDGSGRLLSRRSCCPRHSLGGYRRRTASPWLEVLTAVPRWLV